MTEYSVTHVAGSFRDPSNRVFKVVSDNQACRILRGVDSCNLRNFEELKNEEFFNMLVDRGRIVKSIRLNGTDDVEALDIVNAGWAGVLEHDLIPFISYPYEWTFTMLKDAALLQLEILELAVEHDWILKDATPFNIQFIGTKPIFIDIPSFEPWVQGEPWLAYRQFCSSFLIPLMLQAYLGLDIRFILRAYLDGVPPMEAAKFFNGFSRFRRGVFSHVILPASVESRITVRERDNSPAKKRKTMRHSKSMVIGLIQSMSRLVRGLKVGLTHSDWSDYDQTHSYEDQDHLRKKEFVENVTGHVSGMVWDVGCNTATFSRLLSERAECVLAIDSDHNAVEKVYLQERDNGDQFRNILPLVMNIANMSPGQGWGGNERASFDKRGSPSLVLVLALIHHIRISANIPLDLFLDWLHSLRAEVVIEFVDRHDEMVEKLLKNKKEKYEDYNRDNFLFHVRSRFDIRNQVSLKSGKREVFHLVPM